MSDKHVTWKRESKDSRTMQADAVKIEHKPNHKRHITKAFIIALALLASSCGSRLAGPEDTSRLYVCSVCGNAYGSFEDAAYCHEDYVEVYRGYVDKDNFIAVECERK